MSLNDWILALHLLAAFALIAAEVAFTSMIVSLWKTDSTRRVTSFMLLSRVATVLVIAGTVATIVFGVWLSISKDPYDPWDLWVIIAIVLWVVSSGLGQQAGNAYGSASIEAAKLAEAGTERDPALVATFGPSRAFWMHVASNLAIALILIDMVWKPGA